MSAPVAKQTQTVAVVEDGIRPQLAELIALRGAANGGRKARRGP